jgi:hypothetical protein
MKHNQSEFREADILITPFVKNDEAIAEAMAHFAYLNKESLEVYYKSINDIMVKHQRAAKIEIDQYVASRKIVLEAVEVKEELLDNARVPKFIRAMLSPIFKIVK